MEDLTGQTSSTSIEAVAEWNPLMQEFVNYITDQGITMSVGDLDQMSKATVQLATRVFYQVDSGAADAYVTAAQSGMVAPPAYLNGLVLAFRPTNANTGLATVNMAGLGAKDIVRENGGVLSANDIVTTRDAWMRYDTVAGKFFLFDFSLASSADLPNGFREGLTLSRNPAEAAATFQDIQVEPGRCRDATNARDMAFPVPVVKRFDATIAKGTGVGGYPLTALGARTVSTWYRVFQVGRESGDFALDAGFDSVANDDAAGLLADLNTIEGDSSWTQYRQIGWVRTTAGTADELVPFFNDPNDPSEFLFINGEGTHDFDHGSTIAAGTLARSTVTLNFAPPDSVAILDIHGFSMANNGAGSLFAMIAPIGSNDVAPTRVLYTVGGMGVGRDGGSGATLAAHNNSNFMGQARIQLDSSRQFHIRWFAIEDSGAAWPFGNVRGFIFHS